MIDWTEQFLKNLNSSLYSCLNEVVGLFKMVAPHFQMLASAVPTKAEPDERIALLETVLGQYANEKTIGVGHPIGGTFLLALAGGQALTHSA